MTYEIAGGSTIGTQHRSKGQNCQDAWSVRTGDDLIVAVVADGCGSSKFSEVGAHIGARMMTDSLSRYAREHPCSTAIDLARRQVLAQMQVLALSMGGSYTQVVQEYLLFTLVGCILREDDMSAFFTIGDGIILTNGGTLFSGGYQGNAPPFLGYELLGKCAAARVHLCQLPETFLLATDGLEGYEHNEGWLADGVFANPQTLNRKLRLLNRERTLPDWEERRLRKEHGVLADDTTLIVGRKSCADR